MKIVNGMEMYDTADMARMTGSSPRTIAKHRREGKLHYVRVGRYKLTSRASFEAYLNGTEVEQMKANEHVARVLEQLK